MRVYKVTARFDDGDNSWEDNLGIFRHKSAADKMKREYTARMGVLCDAEEPEQPKYDSSKYPTVYEFRRSDEWQRFMALQEDYRTACWFKDVAIYSWNVSGER